MAGHDVSIRFQSDRDIAWDRLLDSPDRITRCVAIARAHRFLPEAYLYGFIQTRMFALKRNAILLGEFRTTETKFLASDEQRKKMRDALPEEKRARNRKPTHAGTDDGDRKIFYPAHRVLTSVIRSVTNFRRSCQR